MAANAWLHRLALGIALPLAVLTAPALWAAEPKTAAAPAQAETDAAKAVRYTRALETAPLADNALEMRKWLLRWIVETPDHSVLVCDILGALDDENAPLFGELLVQMMGGNVAWQIEHPQDTDEVSHQMAGARSALKMYAAYLADDPKWQVPKLDPAIERERNGTLREHVVQKLAGDCSEESGREKVALGEQSPPPPFLGGFLRETHVIYPLKVPTGWVMQNEHRYDELESGASIRFQREGDVSGWMDVYFYPIGAISKQDLDRLAKAEREQLVTVWKDAATGAPLSALDTFSVPLKGGVSIPAGRQSRPEAITAYAADFTYKHRNNGRRYHSVLVFMVDRLYAIKLRYSADTDKLSRKQARKEAESFARSLLPEVDIISTGKCGSPAMAIGGQMADGCVGEDPIQPVVLEGRRELRFEYPTRR